MDLDPKIFLSEIGHVIYKNFGADVTSPNPTTLLRSGATPATKGAGKGGEGWVTRTARTLPYYTTMVYHYSIDILYIFQIVSTS